MAGLDPAIHQPELDPGHRWTLGQTNMALRLTLLWLAIAVIAAVPAWYLARRVPAAVRWVRIAVAALLLALLAAAYWQFGASMEKTLASVMSYFLLWSAAYCAAALCAGTIAGTLIAAYVID